MRRTCLALCGKFGQGDAIACRSALRVMGFRMNEKQQIEFVLKCSARAENRSDHNSRRGYQSAFRRPGREDASPSD